jgi:hypothetical protein
MFLLAEAGELGVQGQSVSKKKKQQNKEVKKKKESWG